MRTVQEFFLSILAFVLMGSLMNSCTDVDITMPKGPKGDTGLSAYEFWKEKVTDGTITDWPKDQTTETDFFKYLKGKDGQNGKSACLRSMETRNRYGQRRRPASPGPEMES